jgi:tetratricopeptide (TPR) repeat protein
MITSVRFTLLLFFALATAIFLPAQSATNAPATKADYSQEAFVMERYLRKVKLENDGTSVREDSARVRIQSDAGVKRYGLLTFSYASGTGTFEIDYVRVRKPDGTIVETPADNIQDMAAETTREAPFYSDLHEKHIAVKGLGVGDVLEYGMHERVTKPLAPGHFWLEYTFTKSIILLEERLEITVPRERAVKVKSPEFKSTVSDAGAYRIYTWTTSNLEQNDEQKEKQQNAKLTWQHVRGRLPQPDVMVSSFQNWDDVGRWYKSLQEERVKPTPEVRTKAAELTKGAADDDAKMRAIYTYVSTQFRYIGVAFGIGRYQPHSAAEVLANQYGDCKDKHTLLASLLDAVGIKAYPALISTIRDIDGDMPSPTEFNHVITVVPRANDLVWLDTTTEVGPFAYLLTPLRDKHALVIPADQTAHLVTTPTEAPYAALQKFEIDAKLADSGLLEGKATQTYRGDTEILFRAGFRRVPLQQWKELVQGISYASGFGGDVSDVTASAPEKTGEPFHVSYSYKRKDYSNWSEHRITPPLPIISLPALSDDEVKPEVPIWLGSPGDVQFHARLELPKGYVPKTPKAVHLKRDFADFDSSYSVQGGVLTAERHLVIKLREIPVAQFADYKSFRKAVEDDYGAYTILSSAKSGGTANDSYQTEIWDLPYSDNPEAARLYDAAKQEYENQNLQGEIESLKRAVAQDPKFIRAWLWLGEIYRYKRDRDLAMEAYRKAIEIDPDLPVSYKALGSTLMDASRFEEAVGVWQQFIKVAPEDSAGPASLGSTLYLLKRYKEAVTSLESAAKLQSENASLQAKLASAYLRAGDDDKAVTAFRKAIDTSPGPEMFNNVAYELAEADKQLSLALEYGEKAVRAEEEATVKIELAKLQSEDLGHTQRLAAYWDTLGWVHNRMSNFEQAEKYLDAAWKISEFGVTADHLCQVYERMHKTRAAIQMCEFALYRIPLTGGPERTPGMNQMEVTKKRLERLQGLAAGSSKPQNLVAISDAINRMNVFKLPRLVPGTASAEFFVLLVTDSATGTFKVQDVKFISGSEKIKGSVKLLTSINVNYPSPDKTPARFVRRGILGCYEYTGCSFVLLDPNTVRSLN